MVCRMSVKCREAEIWVRMSTTATMWSRSRSSSATRARSTLVSSAGGRGSSVNCSVRMLIIDVLHVRVEFFRVEPNHAIPPERLRDIQPIVGCAHELLPGVNAWVGKGRYPGTD